MKEITTDSKQYLCTIPDEITLTREVFRTYLRRYNKAKKFGFSKKHSKDICDFRKEAEYPISYPDKLYDFPVLWNQDVTFFQ